MQNEAEKWYLIDAAKKPLGRVATKAAELLLGKLDPSRVSKAYLLPRVKVVIVNSDKVGITGNKLTQKLYTNYSGYPGGLRVRTLATVMEKNSKEVISKAVKGMLPKNRRGKAIGVNLYVYKNADHKHEVNNLETISI